MTDKDRIEIAKDIKIDERLVQVLEERGYDTREKINAFLYPSLDNLTDPSEYKGYNEVVDRIRKAIDEKESVILYGDYDCDGICGVSILNNFLKSKGVKVDCFLPNRHNDGYGLSVDALEKLADKYLSDLLITVDCGITSVEEVEYAREVLGFDVIVTDHHEPGEDLPDCLIFNPKLTEKEGVFRELCGAGVALRIVEGIAGREEMLKYVDIAAIATIADVVPLVFDNRIIAKAGLKRINSMDCARGIKMLAKSCSEGEITSYDIGFKIAPRINAAGRISDANSVLDLFCTTDNFLLEHVIKDLNACNEERMQLTDDLTEECMQKLKGFDFENNAVIVLSNAYWDDGIIGIVASRIAETFSRPTVLITKNGKVYKGSGRSVKGINIFSYVSQCADLLAKFGGHAMAFGLTIEEKNIADFAKRLNEAVKKDYPMEYFIPKKRYDIDISEVASALDMARGIKLLEPFGEGNPDIRFKEQIKSMEFSQMGTTQHIVHKEKEREILLFGGLKYKEIFSQNVQKNLYYKMSLQSYRDRVYAQCRISAFTCDEISEQGDFSQYTATGFVQGEDRGEYIDEKQLSDIKTGIFGTCYIAYDIDTYRKFIQKYKPNCNSLVSENRVVSGYAPVSKILFCPASLKELSYYSIIVLLDEPVSTAVFSRIINKNAKLYVVRNVNIFSKLAEYLPSYEKLAQIFGVLKKTLASKKITSASDLYYSIAKECNLEYNEIALGVLIFAELGIVKTSPEFYVDANVKTKLSESKIYARLEAASGRTGNQIYQ